MITLTVSSPEGILAPYDTCLLTTAFLIATAEVYPRSSECKFFS